MSKVALEIEPLTEAVARMDRKMPIARALTSDEWAGVPLALRERSFWTARFAKADVLQVMHDAIGDRLSMTSREGVPGRGPVMMSRDNFIVELRDRLEAAGYVPPQGKAGTIQDLASKGRLGLIFDMNTQMAQGYARWKSGQLEGALQAFPAQELYRAESRVVPRDWIERWRSAGGQFFEGGRMIAAKDDPIWMEISAFDTPWPPFDFNSGMDVKDISRAEAERLGVIAPGQQVRPPQVEFNAKLEKSVEGYAPEIRKALLDDLGSSAVVKDGMAILQPAGTPPAPMPPPQPQSGPTGVPVSRAALLHFRAKAQNRKARHLLDVIDSVHGDGALASLPFNTRVSRKADGSYWSHRSLATSIGVRPTANAGTLAHEVGHWLDHIGIPSATKFASEDSASVLAPVMRAIEASPEIALLKVGATQQTRPKMVEHYDYVLSGRERWARAYAQFIATESKDPEMLNWVRLVRAGRTNYLRDNQWDEASFVPIAEEIRKALTILGWMR